jgi:DNA-binding phage protein
MILSNAQIELLESIQSKIRRGDISAIAEKTGLTREYVGMVLNPDSDHFNESIITEAVEIIATREQNTKNLLKKIIP